MLDKRTRRSMEQFFLTISFVLAAAVITPGALPAASVSDFIDFTLLSQRDTVVLPGRLYVPPEAAAQPSSPRPLMIFLAGSSGSEPTTSANWLRSLTS